MRKGELAFNVFIFLFPAAVGTVMIYMMVAPTKTCWLMFFLLLGGLLLFLKARLSVRKQGSFYSLGMRNMSLSNKVVLFCGYALIVFSMFMLSAVLLATLWYKDALDVPVRRPGSGVSQDNIHHGSATLFSSILAIALPA